MEEGGFTEMLYKAGKNRRDFLDFSFVKTCPIGLRRFEGYRVQYSQDEPLASADRVRIVLLHGL